MDPKPIEILSLPSLSLRVSAAFLSELSAESFENGLLDVCFGTGDTVAFSLDNGFLGACLGIGDTAVLFLENGFFGACFGIGGAGALSLENGFLRACFGIDGGGAFSFDDGTFGVSFGIGGNRVDEDEGFKFVEKGGLSTFSGKEGKESFLFADSTSIFFKSAVACSFSGVVPNFARVSLPASDKVVCFKTCGAATDKSLSRS